MVTSSAIATAGSEESTSTGSSDTRKRPKKCLRHPEAWKKNVAKAKRVKSEAYVSPTMGKTVGSREIGPASKCKRRC